MKPHLRHGVAAVPSLGLGGGPQPTGSSGGVLSVEVLHGTLEDGEASQALVFHGGLTGIDRVERGALDDSLLLRIE